MLGSTTRKNSNPSLANPSFSETSKVNLSDALSYILVIFDSSTWLKCEKYTVTFEDKVYRICLLIIFFPEIFLFRLVYDL